MSAKEPEPDTSISPAQASVKARVAEHSLRESLRSATFGAAAKRYAWRLTAVAFWITLLSRLFGMTLLPSGATAFLVDAIRHAVDVTNLTPPSTRYVGPVLRLGWVLAITNFRLSELFGLLLYCLFSPLTAALYLLFRRAAREYSADQVQQAKKAGLRAPRAESHLRASLALALAAWFFLYGDSTSPLHAAVGALISAALFFAVVVRVFLEARPASGADQPLLPRLERLFFQLSIGLAEEKTPNKKSEIWVSNAIYEKAHWACTRMVLVLRGRRGVARVSAYILFDYLLSLAVMGLAAIVFWALVTKAYVSPLPFSYEAALRQAAAHFFSGITSAPPPVAPPLWVDIGTSATSWILFVLFIGAAGSLIPRRQHVYAERARVTYKHLRTAAVIMGTVLRRRRRHAQALTSSAA